MLYAAYGSNLHPLRLMARIASAQLAGTGFAAGWRLDFHKRSTDGSGKCSIFPDGEGIHVAVFEISTADKHVLDGIEGLGAGYAETVLSIPGFGNCATYVAEPSHVDAALHPYDWYRELVLLGARYHNFPARYLDPILALQTLPDPDPVRSNNNWKTVQWIRAGR